MLAGGGGDDFLFGGTGGDSLYGEAGFDLARYDDATNGVIASLINPGANFGEAAGDVYIEIEGLVGSNGLDFLFGNDAANTLYGLGLADYLYGLGGNDTLAGGDGDDHLLGGAGADTLFGEGGFNFARYDDAVGGVTASLENAAFNTGDAQGDVYSNIAGLVGSGVSDLLAGNSAGNVIYGLEGSDTIFGFLGNDLLIGGGGVDRFTYTAPNEGLDTIADFVIGQDQINVYGGNFGGIAAGTLSASRFALSTANQAFGQFLWHAPNSTLYWDADGTGAGADVALATLSGISNLTHADIVVL